MARSVEQRVGLVGVNTPVPAFGGGADAIVQHDCDVRVVVAKPMKRAARSLAYSEQHTWSSIEKNDLAVVTASSVPEFTSVECKAVKPVPRAETDPDSRMTEADMQSAIVELMKDGSVWTNAQLKAAIAQRLPLSSADRSQSASRPNEERWQELANNALAQIGRSNSLYAKGIVMNVGRGMHRLTERPIPRCKDSQAAIIVNRQ